MIKNKLFLCWGAAALKQLSLIHKKWRNHKFLKLCPYSTANCEAIQKCLITKVFIAKYPKLPGYLNKFYDANIGLCFTHFKARKLIELKFWNYRKSQINCTQTLKANNHWKVIDLVVQTYRLLEKNDDGLFKTVAFVQKFRIFGEQNETAGNHMKINLVNR